MFPVLSGHAYAVRGDGRWNLSSATGITAARGTIDVWLDMGSGAATFLVLHATPDPAVPPFHTLGVNAAGQVTGTFCDSLGVAVAAWAGTTHVEVTKGRPLHIQVAWDALGSINGAQHMRVNSNDIGVPVAGFGTNPITPWQPFIPAYLSTGKYAAEYDGEILLTQISTQVVI